MWRDVETERGVQWIGGRRQERSKGTDRGT